MTVKRPFLVFIEFLLFLLKIVHLTLICFNQKIRGSVLYSVLFLQYAYRNIYCLEQF